MLSSNQLGGEDHIVKKVIKARENLSQSVIIDEVGSLP
jgi:hypothetical protein